MTLLPMYKYMFASALYDGHSVHSVASTYSAVVVSSVQRELYISAIMKCGLAL